MKIKPLIVSALLLPSINAIAADANPQEDVLNKYLVDITGGAVSAINLLSVNKSLVTNIQTSQDLVLAIRPFTSGDDKAAFGISITPAKTDFFPMSGNAYVTSRLNQLIGNLTFSYAQNNADIKNVSYKKLAYSVDTTLYWDITSDPIYLGNQAFIKCHQPIQLKNQEEIQKISQDGSLSLEEKNKRVADLTQKNATYLSDCMSKDVAVALKEAKWNSDRMSVSYGEARINLPGESNSSFGKYLTLNGMIRAGNQGALNLSLRKSRDVLDATSIGAPALNHSSSNLVGVRYTYGDQDAKKFRGIIEVSNANKYTGSDARGTFMYAIGLDKKIADGIWLEFRLGRNRTIEGNEKQTTGLLNISFQPSLTTFR